MYALDKVNNEIFAISDGLTIDRDGPEAGLVFDGLSGEDIDFYKDTKKYEVKLFNQRNFLADKYFDVKFNEWDMSEFGKHLKIAQNKCKMLPQPLKS